MRKPNFLIIGAQRCGTTSLRNYLRQHPQIEMSGRKELHYFNREYGRGFVWYKRHFVSRGFAVGEATPYYIFHPQIPSRVKAELSDAKIIVLLRNPVDRAYSHYNHEIYGFKRPIEKESFEKALFLEGMRTADDFEKTALGRESVYPYSLNHFTYKRRGLYVEQLERWFKLFEKENILVIQTEYMKKHRDETLNRVFDFLGASPFKGNFYKFFNSRYYEGMEKEIRDGLLNFFRQSNERLKEFLKDKQCVGFVDWSSWER